MPPVLCTNASASSLAPRCMALFQRVSPSAGFNEVSALNGKLLAHQMQSRGKKTKKKGQGPEGVLVKLIEDVPTFGPKGSIVITQAGKMRNQFYPAKLARYLTKEEAKTVKADEVNTERSRTFGVEITKRVKGGAEIVETTDIKVEQPARPTELPDTVRADLVVLKPQRAFQLLSELLPPTLTFYRAPVVPTHQETASPLPDRGPTAASSPLSEALRQATSIYGSVSTTDVVNNIRVLVESSDIKGRIALDETDVQFVKRNEAGAAADEGSSASPVTEGDRVKHLGDFEVDIKIKGHPELLRRIVCVRAESEQPAAALESQAEANTPVFPMVAALSGLASQAKAEGRSEGDAGKQPLEKVVD